MRAFTLLGRTDRGAIVECLREALTQWGNEWCCLDVGVPEVDLITESLCKVPLPLCEWRTGALVGDIKAAVGLTAQASGALLSALIHGSLLPVTNHFKSAEVEMELRIGAVDALIAALLEHSDTAAIPIKYHSKKLEDAVLDLQQDVMVARCRLLSIEMFIVVYSGLTERCVRRRSRDTVRDDPEVMSVRDAVAAQTLTLEICAGAAEFTLEDLNELAVGDVIVLDRRLNEPLVIEVAEGVRCAVGYLGFQAGHKAVQIAISNANNGVESNG